MKKQGRLLQVCTYFASLLDCCALYVHIDEIQEGCKLCSLHVAHRLSGEDVDVEIEAD